MLSRTADNLYWMGRYMERAENTARLLSGTQRLSLMPIPTNEHDDLWRNLFQSTGEVEAFQEKHEEFTEIPVIDFLALELDNPSSIRSCIRGGRENVRAARHVLTTEISQSINQTWMDVRQCTLQEVTDRGTQDFLDSIKERAHHLRGVIYGTMRRGEPFLFWQLGSTIERAENTSRLMLARSNSFHRASRRDDGFEFYRWGTFLRSANAYSAYRQLYREIDPMSVADLLILNTEIPRSLLACIEDVCETLRTLRREAPCTAMAEHLAAEIRTIHLERILRSGLDGFLADFTKSVHALSDQISVDFIMVR
jgi:uncharacterized alpha-E superfamily protein